MEKKFEILPHTADLHIRAYGSNIDELFCNILIGMFSALKPKIDPDVEGKSRPFEVEAPDRELLLVDFLAEALYLSDVHHEAYLDVEIEEITDTHIKGVLHGTAITDFEDGEIKAVTHHGLTIHQQGDLLVAEVLFDL